MATIGIRREDKHEWEARVPLTPDGVRGLVAEGVAVKVQPSSIRAFSDDDYRQAGAEVGEDLSACDVVFAVKEVPTSLLRPGGSYVFFSHTIKGQAHNMPLLKRIIEQGCTLIDYERIVDDEGRRLVFFGHHAGLAGMIDSLHVLGKRLQALGHTTVFAELPMAHAFKDLDEARQAVRQLGERLAAEPLPAALAPFILGFAGYGNVSRGAQEIYDLLPVEEVAPEQLPTLLEASDPPRDRLYKVVFKERHLVEPCAEGSPFELQEYYQHPERYRSIFAPQLRRLSMLINAIYWTDAYPRLVESAALRTWFTEEPVPRLLAIGDISCDIEGAVQCTVKATTPGSPAYVYDPVDGSVHDGVEGRGLVMMTTDCLPCELPRESSTAFTEALAPFAASIARADLSGSLLQSGLPAPIRRATLVWRGELCEDFRYLESFLP